MKKLIIFSLSLAYCIYLSSILAADLCQGKVGTVPVEGIPHTKPRGLSLNYINLAIKLNPLNSEYHYQKYLNQKGLSYIQSAIELEPTKAAYHMFYALALLKQKGLAKEGTVPAVDAPDTKPRGLSLNLYGPALDSLILHELESAVKLKPFSKLYQKTLNDYLPSLQSHP